MAETDTPPFMLEGPIDDTLYLGGARPKADARDDYLAGGSVGFPLTGQVELSRACDDISRDLGFEVYDAMMQDPTCASAVFVVVSAALGGKFSVVPRYDVDPGESLEGLAPQERLDIENAAWASSFLERQFLRQRKPFKSTAFEMLYDGLAHGTKLAEIVLEEGTGDDAGLACLKRLRVKRHKAWAYVVDPYGDVVAIRGTTEGGNIVDLPPQKFMTFVWMPHDDDPRGRSLLRPAYNGWNLKLNSWKKLYTYLDRFGNPITVGTVAPDAPDEAEVNSSGVETGNTVTATQAMGSQLNRLEGGSWIALRAGATVNIYGPAGNGEAFLSAIQMFKREILEGILMTARATLEAEHGSKADSQEAGHVVAHLIAMVRETYEATLDRDLCHFLLEINRGKEFADRYCPHSSFGAVSDEDVAAVMAGFVAAGWVLDPGHFPHVDARFNLVPRKLKDGERIKPPVEQDKPPAPQPGAPVVKPPKAKV